VDDDNLVFSERGSSEVLVSLTDATPGKMVQAWEQLNGTGATLLFVSEIMCCAQ